MTTSLVYVTCEQWSETTGSNIPVVYIANNMNDGYIYYNDYRFYRTWIHNDANKYQTEIYNIVTNTWVKTESIQNIKLYNYNIENAIKIMLGGTSTPIDGSSVEFTNSSYPTSGSGIEFACNWAIAVANDPACGYSWITRDGNPNYDCSSLMYHAFYNAGFTSLPIPAGNTTTMITDFTNAGFTWIDWLDLGDSSNLIRGDILLNIVNHAALYLGNNTLVEASWCEVEEWDFYTMGDCRPGDQGNEIYWHAYYNYPWDGILRYDEGNIIEI